MLPLGVILPRVSPDLNSSCFSFPVSAIISSCLLFESESMPPWMLPFEFVHVCPRQAALLAIYREAQGDTLQKRLTEFYGGLKLTFSNWPQTDPGNKKYSKHIYQPLSLLLPTFTWVFFFIRLQFKQPIAVNKRVLHCLYINTCVTLGSGAWKVNNVRLQLCISWACKSWVHGKSKARKAGC